MREKPVEILRAIRGNCSVLKLLQKRRASFGSSVALLSSRRKSKNGLKSRVNWNNEIEEGS